MAMPFLRKTAARDPLPVTMSGVRMGERLLQIDINDPRVAGMLAAKVGLSGHAAMAVTDEAAAARARAAIADAGVLADVHVTGFDALPVPSDSFDVLVVHNAQNRLAGMDELVRSAAAREWHRVLRPGGRLVVIEAGTKTGLAALLRPAPKRDSCYDASGGTVNVLEAAGFRPVRMLGDREGYAFVEGMKT